MTVGELIAILSEYDSSLIVETVIPYSYYKGRPLVSLDDGLVIIEGED